MRRVWRVVPLALLLALSVSGCGSDGGGGGGDGGGGGNAERASDYADFQELALDVCAPEARPFSLDIDNEFFPLTVGQQSVLEGEDDGETITVQITVLDETEEVAGVITRVVEEAEWEDDELVEVSRNFFVQASDGTVCYYGEDVDIYEDGEIVSHEGAWRAGEDGNQPGIIMPADPQVGEKFAQEAAPGVAEDMSAITDLGLEIETPAGTFADTVRAFDWNPLEGEKGDVKFYVRGIGLAIDEDAKLMSF